MGWNFKVCTWYRKRWIGIVNCVNGFMPRPQSTVRAPVFGRHQFFGTSEHYGKAHGSLLSGWMNHNYTACCWFPTSSNILNTSITVLTNQVWKLPDCTDQSAEYWCFYGTCKSVSLPTGVFPHLKNTFPEMSSEISCNLLQFPEIVKWLLCAC